jgi:DNA invertase Pin-like site-specific DNA recombinase
MKRAALYVRVSTDRQTVENQIARLTEIAKGRGWHDLASHLGSFSAATCHTGSDPIGVHGEGPIV